MPVPYKRDRSKSNYLTIKETNNNKSAIALQSKLPYGAVISFLRIYILKAEVKQLYKHFDFYSTEHSFKGVYSQIENNAILPSMPFLEKFASLCDIPLYCFIYLAENHEFILEMTPLKFNKVVKESKIFPDRFVKLLEYYREFYPFPDDDSDNVDSVNSVN